MAKAVFNDHLQQHTRLLFFLVSRDHRPVKENVLIICTVLPQWLSLAILGSKSGVLTKEDCCSLNLTCDPLCVISRQTQMVHATSQK